MARRTPGRVQMTCATTGSGPYTLANPIPALTGKRTVAQAVTDGSLINGDEILYAIVDPAAAGSGRLMEVGRGTINTATLVLTVVQVYEKSATLTSGGGWGAGTRDVLISPPGAWNTAFLDLANIFTSDQSLDGTSPSLNFTNGGVTRSRLLYTSSVSFRQHFNASSVIRSAQDLTDSMANLSHYTTGGVLDGSIEVGAGTLKYNNGAVVVDVDKFASGTAMVFKQAAAPTGWTKSTADNDAALRVVSGTPGASGGTLPLSSANTGGHVLSVNELAVHTHPLGSGGSGVYGEPTAGVAGRLIPSSASKHSLFTATESTGGDLSHNHPLALKYVDCLVATKN